MLDRQDAEPPVQELIAEIKTVWARWHEIVPRPEKRQRPTAMDIYRLLPATYCKTCGQPRCFAFALQLAAGARSWQPESLSNQWRWPGKPGDYALCSGSADGLAPISLPNERC